MLMEHFLCNDARGKRNVCGIGKNKIINIEKKDIKKRKSNDLRFDK